MTGCAVFSGLSAALCFYILIEITLSAWIATLFGLFFIIVALFMTWRAISYLFQYHTGPDRDDPTLFTGNGGGGSGSGSGGGGVSSNPRAGEFNGEWIHLITLLVITGQVFASGVICFVVDKDFAHNLSVHAKVPLYILLSVSMCFAWLFVVFDAWYHVLISYPEYQLLPKPFLSNLFAVRLMGVACLVLGIYFGSLFGHLENEEIARSHIEVSLERENDYGYPIAALLGGCVGFVIQFARLQAPSPIELRFMNDGDGL